MVYMINSYWRSASETVGKVVSFDHVPPPPKKKGRMLITNLVKSHNVDHTLHPK